MRGLRPIPIIGLPSTMEVQVPAPGEGEFEEPRTIHHVRFVDVSALEHTEIVLEEDSLGVIYVDAVNSEGAFAVPVGSLVSVDGGEQRAVIKATTELGFGRAHHWKLEVR